MSKDIPFVDVGKKASDSNFLGHRSTVEKILRMSIHSIFESEFERQIILKEADKVASIFLGENSQYISLRKWNESGGVDVFLKRHLRRIEESDAKSVVKHAFLLMIERIISICAVDDDKLEEQWLFECDATVTQFTDLFMGVDQRIRLGS